MPDATSAEIVLLLLSETEVDRSSHYDCFKKQQKQNLEESSQEVYKRKHTNVSLWWCVFAFYLDFSPGLSAFISAFRYLLKWHQSVGYS